MCKSLLICTVALACSALSVMAALSPVAAQTPTPDASPIPGRPDFERALVQLDAQPTSDPKWEASSQDIAARYALLLNAAVIQVQVFVIPPATTFEKIVEVYETLFGQGDWQISETASEKTETYSSAAWTNRSEMFLVYHQPASQNEPTAVLATVYMLLIPEFPGVEPVEASNNSALAAIADQVARGIAERTGAQTEVKVMTVSAGVPISDILRFYNETMIEAGWSPVDAFTQTDDKFSSMGWIRDHILLIIFVSPVSQDVAEGNVLLWIVARLPAPDATVTP